MSTDTTLSESNYRDFAKRIIEKYSEKNMIIDALLWAQVIGFYEAALENAAFEQSMREANPPPPPVLKRRRR